MIHLKRRVQGGEGGEIRLAFLHSDPAVPHGQLWDCFESMARSELAPEFRVSHERDGDDEAKELVEWMEPYDALAATFCQNKCVKLVKSYASWSDIREDLKSNEALPYNLLWAGNWLFEAVGTYEHLEPRDQRGRMEEAVRLMEELTTRRGVALFPPIEYVLSFARKVRYLTHLASLKTLPQNLVVPPTVPLDLGDRRWKKIVMAVRSLFDVEYVLMKREVSGRGNHVIQVREEQKIPSLPDGTLEWMVQPYNSAFDVRREMRMYVVRGVCRWGVATRKVDAKDAPCEAVAPGLQVWDQAGGSDAAAAAEMFAREYCRSLNNPSWLCDTATGDVWFLRVDMVALDGDYSVWLLNEIEFFGNADLHFECMSGSGELLKEMQSAVNAWIGSTFCQYRQMPLIPELHQPFALPCLENDEDVEVVDLAEMMVQAEQALALRRQQAGLLPSMPSMADDLFSEAEMRERTNAVLTESQLRNAMIHRSDASSGDSGAEDEDGDDAKKAAADDSDHKNNASDEADDSGGKDGAASNGFAKEQSPGVQMLLRAAKKKKVKPLSLSMLAPWAQPKHRMQQQPKSSVDTSLLQPNADEKSQKKSKNPAHDKAREKKLADKEKSVGNQVAKKREADEVPVAPREREEDIEEEEEVEEGDDDDGSSRKSARLNDKKRNNGSKYEVFRAAVKAQQAPEDAESKSTRLLKAQKREESNRKKREARAAKKAIAEAQKREREERDKGDKEEEGSPIRPPPKKSRIALQALDASAPPVPAAKAASNGKSKMSREEHLRIRRERDRAKRAEQKRAQLEREGKKKSLKVSERVSEEKPAKKAAKKEQVNQERAAKDKATRERAEEAEAAAARKRKMPTSSRPDAAAAKKDVASKDKKAKGAPEKKKGKKKDAAAKSNKGKKNKKSKRPSSSPGRPHFFLDPDPPKITRK